MRLSTNLLVPQQAEPAAKVQWPTPEGVQVILGSKVCLSGTGGERRKQGWGDLDMREYNIQFLPGWLIFIALPSRTHGSCC